jgi:hypothetical protein
VSFKTLVELWFDCVEVTEKHRKENSIFDHNISELAESQQQRISNLCNLLLQCLQRSSLASDWMETFFQKVFEIAVLYL